MSAATPVRVPARSRTPPLFRLTPGVRVAENVESGTPVAVTPDGRSFTLGADLGALGRELAQGATTGEDLTERLAPAGWDAWAVHEGLRVLLAQGLAQPQGGAVVRPRRRWSALSLGLFNPESLCRRLVWWSYPLRGWWGLVLSVIGLAGQIGLVVWLPATVERPGGPALVALGLLVVVTVCHELAHGVVLTAAGGHPQRMGLMLIYFLPAFFCDVADSIRLPRRAQLETALAGLAVQCQLGFVLGAVALLGGPAVPGVSLFLTLNLMLAAANLIPCLPLDGYIALAALLGRPDLRSHAIAAWRSVWRRPADVERVSPGWLWVVFGALCQAAPGLVALTVVGTFVIRLV